MSKMRFTLQKKKIFVISACALAALAVLSLLFIARGYSLTPSYLSGDEPHYVMMADSLVRDGDFNLKNDYQSDRSSAYYLGGQLPPHNSPLVDIESDQWYSIHTVGVPLVIAVPFKLFGVEGARLWMMLLQGSLVVTFFFVLRKYLGSNMRALIGAGLGVICPLFWQNLGSLFPDLLLVSLWMFTILLFGRKDPISNIAMVAIGVIAGLAHTKGLLLIAPLLLAHIAFLIWEDGLSVFIKKQWLAMSVGFLGVVLYVRFLYMHYGIFTPSGLYGNNGQLFGGNLIYNAVAMLTDRNKGLFVHFPLLLIVVPYLAFFVIDLVKTTRKLARQKLKLKSVHFLTAALLVGLAVSLATIVGFEDWSGSTAPNGRSILPFIVVAIFVFAKYLNIHSRLEVLLVGSFALLSIWLSWLSIIDFKTYMSPGVNSFWVDRFQLLNNLPMFGFVSVDTGRAPLILGLKMLALLLALNICLYVLFKYRVTLKERDRSSTSL